MSPGVTGVSSRNRRSGGVDFRGTSVRAIRRAPGLGIVNPLRPSVRQDGEPGARSTSHHKRVHLSQGGGAVGQGGSPKYSPDLL